MTMKKMLSVGAAVMLVLMAITTMVPAASADKHSIQGNISRTFDWYAWLDFQTDDDAPGIGWFDPDDRDNNCLFRLFGLDVGTGFYYDTLRIKVKTDVKESVVVPETFLGVGCPFATADDNADIGWTEFVVKAGPGIAQSHLLCTDTFSLCSPKEATAKWTLFECKGDKPTFAPGDLIATFLGPLFTGPPFVGSSAMECDTTSEEPNLYNATGFLRPEDRQSSRTIFIDWVKKNAEGGYIGSCFEMEYSKEDEQHLAQSHDWFLNYNPASGVDPLVNHFAGGTHPLKGLYDLSGDNGCPHKGDGQVIEKKDPTLP